MTPGQLVKAVSIALDVPEETVVQHDRNLVVAGLRTTGARGRNAPHVTTLDAARLLVATLGSVRTKDSVETVEFFEQAIFNSRRAEREALRKRLGEPPAEIADPEDGADIAISNLPRGHNFIEGLAAVIAEASKPIDDLQAHLMRFSNLGLTCSSFGGGAIGGLRGVADYFVPRGNHPVGKESQREREEREYCRTGISQTRIVGGTAIMLLGSAFRDNGLQYANAREAYLAGYGARDAKKAPAKARKKVGKGVA
jgi:hypothetical protein